MEPVYLDCAATTPIEPKVLELVTHFLGEEMGNAGSRTHEFGNRAKVAVQNARSQVGAVVGAPREDVIFTSGATESNNLAILGLAEALKASGKTHLITSRIEHKAVLEPMAHLAGLGFQVTYLDPEPDGLISAESLTKALRTDTGLVSLMHVNNETGALHPIDAFCDVLTNHGTYFHVDAAQGFGKIPSSLLNTRIDLISASGHKLYAPKGVGALVYRRREYKVPPLKPLMFGGGQERGLRPGTIPVHLVVGFGLACELAVKNGKGRRDRCEKTRTEALKHLLAVGGISNTPLESSLPSILNVSFPGLDSEAVMLALKPIVAVSNGSACTSQSYTPSHVLQGLKLDAERVQSAIRFSWSHLTAEVPWKLVAETIAELPKGRSAAQ